MTQVRENGLAVDQVAGHRLNAFGLEVRTDWPVPGSEPAAGSNAEATVVRRLPAERVEREWSPSGERIYQREVNGETVFTVERTGEQYRFQLKGFGRYLVSRDGTQIGCERDGAPLDAQERLIFAQALPLASALQGFELLHASAIATAAGVAGFVGPSGAGKTTLTSQLVLRGAGFVTDDVLALEARDGMPVAHPGAPFLGVPHGDRLRLTSGRLGTVVGSSDKIHVARPTVRSALPLRALYHLETGPSVEIEPLGAGDVRRVFANVFAPYLATRERLERNFKMAELIERKVDQFRLRIPRTETADAALAAVESHLRKAGN